MEENYVAFGYKNKKISSFNLRGLISDVKLNGERTKSQTII